MKHVKNVTNNTPVNKEDTNMDQNNQATVNAAEAAATQVAPESAQVPTPPQTEAQEATPEKPKKKGLIKKILLIIGAILALITGGFIAGRVSGKKNEDDDDVEYIDIDNDQNS